MVVNAEVVLPQRDWNLFYGYKSFMCFPGYDVARIDVIFSILVNFTGNKWTAHIEENYDALRCKQAAQKN